MEMFEEEGAGNTPEFSVSELSGAVKRTIEGEYGFVRVRGEVGRVSRPRSGHYYLDLKDDRAVISGVMWKGVAARQQTLPEEGMEVVATGKLTTFPGQSKYQIVIDEIRPAGAGALMAMLEKRKAMLQAEGLFAAERKRPLPYLPEIIGVVTSPSGAVIRDILHRLRDRFPRKVLIWPVAVQGNNCAPEVARAIDGFNRLTPGGALPRPDLLIVARGGGSVEDLWGFNEEIVARAAAASEIPLISAVGHETDTTLIDFVSDQRAPTPTAAAEMAVPVRVELLGWTAEAGARMTRAMGHRVETRGQRLRDLSRALPRVEDLLNGPRQRLDIMATRLPDGLTRLVDRRRLRLSEVSGSLKPSMLTRGFAQDRAKLGDRAARLQPALSRMVQLRRDGFEARARQLNAAPIQREIRAQADRLEALTRRLSEAQTKRIETGQTRLEALDRLHETLGYKATLKRGYAVVRGADGSVITSAAAAAKTGVAEIEFSDARFSLDGTAPVQPAEAPAAKPKPAKPARKTPPPEQGSLF
ncbi:MAG: exodeoxyribonuclease VII large subunit [Pelagimonas sp.]|jgi:exodeoxyribonuclease VII large subunit|nr:exodeoxyribonuclease VII large subunit [Pelagimonas sp.]